MTDLEIAPGTDNDVDQILDLLLLEYDVEAGVGFYGNRNLIRKGVGEDLWVARENGQVVGFLLGKYSPNILWVVPNQRSRHVGTKLFERALQRAFDDNVNAMEIECKPPLSYGFWVKQGFERYGPSGPWDPITARRILPRTLIIPAGLQPTSVEISFFPEDALYGEDLPATITAELVGGKDQGGVIWLPQRVIASMGGGWERDPAVKIIVDGQHLYFRKAKYDEARALGVEKDSGGATFYVDRILLPKGGH